MKIGFMGALALLFTGLKLGGIISWSWWWVLLPIWGTWALMLLVFVIAMIIGGLE